MDYTEQETLRSDRITNVIAAIFILSAVCSLIYIPKSLEATAMGQEGTRLARAVTLLEAAYPSGYPVSETIPFSQLGITDSLIQVSSLFDHVDLLYWSDGARFNVLLAGDSQPLMCYSSPKGRYQNSYAEDWRHHPTLVRKGWWRMSAIFFPCFLIGIGILVIGRRYHRIRASEFDQ